MEPRTCQNLPFLTFIIFLCASTMKLHGERKQRAFKGFVVIWMLGQNIKVSSSWFNYKMLDIEAAKKGEIKHGINHQFYLNSCIIYSPGVELFQKSTRPIE